MERCGGCCAEGTILEEVMMELEKMKLGFKFTVHMKAVDGRP